MADEKKDAQEGAQADSQAKKSKTKLILIILVGLLVLGGGGFGAYMFLTPKPAEETEQAAEEKSSMKDLDKLVGTMVPLETFLVNIEDNNQTTRFLKTTLTLELQDEDLQEEISVRIAQIRDGILILLSSKKFSDIRTYDGKYILREEILEQLNSILVTGKLKNIYFTEFVVQ